jgi:outer membrane lipoprotein-sorting protein
MINKLGEKMKNIILITLILGGVFFSACATKDDGSYDRANRASEKSLMGLEKDTK